MGSVKRGFWHGFKSAFVRDAEFLGELAAAGVLVLVGIFGGICVGLALLKGIVWAA